MAKILVSLVSEQTPPNIFLIRELDDIDFYLLMTTSQMEQKNKSGAIIAASDIPADKVNTLTVPEDSMTDIENALDLLDFQDNDHFIVNLTGGTKIMSIAVYNYFRNRESEIYYLPIGKNEYHKIFPEVKNRIHPLHYRIPILDYMTACDVTVQNPEEKNTLVKDPEYTRRFFNFFCNSSSLDSKDISSLREIMNQKRKQLKKEPLAVDSEEWLPPFLERAQFTPQENGTLQRSEIRYLCGEWFEEYVYNLVKGVHQLDDAFIARGMQIERKGVQNELDVVFTLNNNLHVIECKTGLFDSSAKRNLLDETIYKAQALRREFTLFARSHIFTTVEPGDSKLMVREHSERRSRLFGINLVDGSTLKDDAEQIKAVKALG